MRGPMAALKRDQFALNIAYLKVFTGEWRSMPSHAGRGVVRLVARVEEAPGPRLKVASEAGACRGPVGAPLPRGTEEVPEVDADGVGQADQRADGEVRLPALELLVSLVANPGTGRDLLLREVGLHPGLPDAVGYIPKNLGEFGRGSHGGESSNLPRQLTPQ